MWMEYKIYTIGHSNRKFDEFVRLLKLHRIELLVDVRRYPRSKFEWFHKDYLQSHLPKHNIQYECFRVLGALGLSRDVKAFEDITCTNSPTYRSYITYLLTSKIAREHVFRLIDFVRGGKICCIMCCERFPWRCHRNYLSDFLTILGIKVIHIIDIGRTMEHKGTRCFDYIKEKISIYWNI